MKTILASLLLMVAIPVSEANSATLSGKDLERHYMDTLTNIVFQLNDAGVFADWLDSFKKSENYNPDTMAKVLVSIARRGIATTNKNDLHMSKASINAMEHMLLTNALSTLREWTLQERQLAVASFSAYGEIAGHDDRYIKLGKSAVTANMLGQSFVVGQMALLLSLDNRLANGQKIPQRYRLQEKSKLKMAKMVINYEEDLFESCMSHEEISTRCLDGYTNSLEHLRSQRRINEFLLQEKDLISKKSYYRIIGDNRLLSDEEWYRRATNACQTEIARVMALPENERLNMTAILDARIAAIEAAEARAVRRAVWKRRLRLGAFILPISVIVFAAIFARRRMNR